MVYDRPEVIALFPERARHTSEDPFFECFAIDRGSRIDQSHHN